MSKLGYIHDKIFVQYFNEDGEERPMEEITWAEDQVQENDIEYILADQLTRYKAVEDELRELRRLIDLNEGTAMEFNAAEIVDYIDTKIISALDSDAGKE